jgi:hypothetical protein
VRELRDDSQSPKGGRDIGWQLSTSAPAGCDVNHAPNYQHLTVLGFILEGLLWVTCAAVSRSSTERPLRPPLRAFCCIAAN